jgi:hypothetical protein
MELSDLGFGVNWVLVRAHFRKGPKTVRAAGWGFAQGPNKDIAMAPRVRELRTITPSIGASSYREEPKCLIQDQNSRCTI